MSRRIDFKLNKDELNQIEQAISHSSLPEVRQRATAIRLLHLGYKPEIVAEKLAVAPSTIRRWHRRYRAQGLEGLANRAKSARPRKANVDYVTAVESTLESDRRRSRFVVFRAVVLMACAGLLWLASLPLIDPSKMTDLGLISVIPISVYAALAILAFSFCLLVYRPEGYTALLYLHIVLLIFIIHGTPQIVYGTLRYSWAWKHVGIIDYIQRHHTVNPKIETLNAYHNWPGFFIVNALIADVSGLKTVLAYAGWGPVFYNLIDLGALLLIFKSLTADKRLIWLAAWFFYFANWVGQDYFSPQATAYFLYLLVLGICIRWFRPISLPSQETVKRWLKYDKLARFYLYVVRYRARDYVPKVEINASQQMGLTVMLALFFITIASTHQLTPFMAITALCALFIGQRLRSVNLPLLMMIFTAAWIVYVATFFLDGNINSIVKSIGSWSDNFNSTLAKAAQASPSQTLVSRMDRAQSMLVIVLAFLGAVRRLRRGYWDLIPAMLIVSPIVILGANDYGGEVLFRVLLFGFPFYAFLAASLIYTTPTTSRRIFTVLPSFIITAVLFIGFCFGYYGKDNQYYFTKNEIAAANYVLDNAPPGALILDGVWDWPLQYRNYELYVYLSLINPDYFDQDKLASDPVSIIEAKMKEYPAAFLVFTHSQKEYFAETGSLIGTSLDKIEEALLRSPNFKVLYRNKDAIVFGLAY